MRQPEVKKNPYTGEPMKMEAVGFPNGSVDKKGFRKWLVDFMPNFTLKIQSKRDYELLVRNPLEKDINKVLLFTKKEKVTPVFRALVSHFRDQLRFFVVPLPEKNPSKDNEQLKEHYKVEKLPALVVDQTFDALNN
mmetsp:Transcript_3358/g.5611  ORF Transcript_3358/g.5611 Transcript_3358/m.5611 type:complete len:136 (-) Transcript_3358:1630-2037(-)